MTEDERNLVYRIARMALVLWIGLMLFQCGGGEVVEEPEPTVTPDRGAAVALDYDVSRERAQVKAHVVGESDDTTVAELFTLPDSNWRDMLDHGRVWTDHAGRADLRAECSQPAGGAPECDCKAVILYENGDLVARACHPEDPQATCVVGQAALDECDICFETLSSRDCPDGTWMSVTYLRESEITIVTVGEGAATVRPVTVLDYQEADPFEFEFTTREWSTQTITLEAETISTESGQASLPYFLYTAPDANLKRIKIQAEEMGIELPPPGSPLPIDQLPILVDPEFGLPPVLETLAWEEPNLQLWMYDLSNTVYERGGIIFPPFMPPYRDEGLIIDFDGELLADTRVQEAVVLGIDKEYIMAEAFTDEEVPGFHAFIGGIPVDAFTLPYDPEQASALLEEVAFSDQLVLILFPMDDDALAYAAKLIAGAVSGIGIKDLPMPVPTAEFDAIRQEYAYARQPVIVIYR